MICITGDMHGDLRRLSHKNIRALKKNDYLIICGDFGFLWNGSAREKSILKSLGRKRYNVLFVDGCHENFDLLSSYEETDWNGGRVRVISGKLRQLMRGYVFTLGDRKIFTFGGGHGDEADIRKEANTWWKDEVPTEEEIARAKLSLSKNKNTVDYIITHEPPASIRHFLQIDTHQQSEMSSYFDEIKSTCYFKRWFFGKYHKNKIIPPQYQGVFDDVIKID